MKLFNGEFFFWENNQGKLKEFLMDFSFLVKIAITARD